MPHIVKQKQSLRFLLLREKLGQHHPHVRAGYYGFQNRFFLTPFFSGLTSGFLGTLHRDTYQ